MTRKQQKFVDEYLIDLNATQAAIRAGYSKNTASAIGSENLTKPEIKVYIDGQLAKIHNERIADSKEVLQYLTAVMRGKAQADVVVVENIGDFMSQARSFKKLPDEKERLKAAELIGKRHGLFKENISVSGAIPVVISDDLGGVDES